MVETVQRGQRTRRGGKARGMAASAVSCAASTASSSASPHTAPALRRPLPLCEEERNHLASPANAWMLQM